MRGPFTVLLLFILLFPVDTIARVGTEHKVYFEGTSYELHVYKIYGRQPGNTMLIIGGIQGDEPGGFLSADLYADLTLEKGNLIVVPRANFKSIILFKRGVDGDMNRIFDRDNGNSMMDRVVAVIKGLMKEADVFLNLHDGYGFYRPEYIDELRNPWRFGQSIIIDTDVYQCSDGRQLRLQDMAERVLSRVNEKIKEPRYYMHLMNTWTDRPDTPYPAMKKTATFYALKYHCLPAFGVETSKNLPDIELKVLHHNYVINEFMRLFDIVPEQPRVLLIKPIFKYAVVNVGGRPFIVSNNETITLEPETEIMVTHIESNYERGLSCDIVGIGDLNDFRRPLRINHDTRIVFRKDSEEIGMVNIRVKRDGEPTYWVFLVKINGKTRAVLANEEIVLREGDEIELLKVIADNRTDRDLPLNFKGFVPSNKEKNTGDDRGIKIRITKSGLLKRFSRHGKGVVYPVVIEGMGKAPPGFWIRLKEG